MGCLALYTKRFGGRCGLPPQCSRYYGVQIVHVECVLTQQLRAARCVSLLVPCAQVLSDEGSVAVGEVAVVDLLRIV
jgi:hypothetical protein